MARSTGMNPSINESIGQWPAHQQKQFKAIVSQNHNRIQSLTDEQFDHFQSLEFTWLDLYSQHKDVPDALAEALGCRQVLNIVLKD